MQVYVYMRYTGYVLLSVYRRRLSGRENVGITGEEANVDVRNLWWEKTNCRAKTC